MYDAMSDSELLHASLAGSKEAFGVVVERYQSLVCALAYSATGDVGRSEELAQEAFLRVWKSLRQLHDLGRFRAWLCTIARNLISQSIRQRPKDVIHAADSLEGAEVISAATPDPGRAAMDKEQRELVWAAVQQVPQKYREPLVLFYREQQSVSRVAADLGLSEDMVRQRLHRGRQLIKTQVASLVADTLARSRPGKIFTITVVAALPAIMTPTASAAVAGIVAKGAPVTKTVLAAHLSGAILGPILGLLGGLLGAWCGIRTTNSPGERRFMIRLVLLVYGLLLVLVGLPLTLTLAGLVPRWICWSCLGVFFAVLLPLIFWSNAHQQRIQIEEGTCSRPNDGLAYVARSGAHGSFAGPIFGGTLWLLILAGHARDWVSFGVIVVCDVLLLLGATAFYARTPQRYWSVALLTVCALLLMTLAAINFRWAAWVDAYRRSPIYDAGNDVSLLTLNLILLAFLVALLVLFARQYARHKAPRGDQTPDGRP